MNAQKKRRLGSRDERNGRLGEEIGCIPLLELFYTVDVEVVVAMFGQPSWRNWRVGNVVDRAAKRPVGEVKAVGSRLKFGLATKVPLADMGRFISSTLNQERKGGRRRLEADF